MILPTLRRTARASRHLTAILLAGAAGSALGANGVTTKSDVWKGSAYWSLAADDRSSKGESREKLFGDEQQEPSKGESRDKLFGQEPGSGVTAPTWRGFVRGELAYTYAEPAHWSKMLVRSELDGQGSLAPNVKYKIGARFAYDFVYDATDFYPPDVRSDQRANFILRENYIDLGAGDWDFRIGKQHIVWGEMVGLFFADVVSAKDLREFILPDFDTIRIPQWALRTEYFKGDFHAEAIWIPAASYDDIGKPGAEFFPAVPPPPPGYATLFDNEQFPKREISHSNYGVRLSYLHNGWDLSGFYYGSMDVQPTFYRQIQTVPEPAFVYQARHDRIEQAGGTLAKDLGQVVFKAETVYTRGRGYNTLDLSDDDGVVRQDTLDLVAGLDFDLPQNTRFNVQLFNRTFFDHDPNIIYDRNESGFSVLLNHKFGERLQAEVLYIASLNRTDYMVRPRLIWDFQRNWQLISGVDVFGGPPLGFFGQYDNRDRVYTEVRYSF